MRDVRNKTMLPIRIPLPGGKVLHLGPHKVAQIADSALEHAGVKRLVKAGSIEVLGEGERAEGASDSGKGPQQTHGPRQAFRRGQGER